MKAGEILEHFLSGADWVDRATTVDRITAGDPEKETRSILVTWMCTLDAVKYAAEHGFDMIITHEATFWIHDAHEPEIMSGWEAGHMKQEAAALKKQMLEENGIVVVRNHDVWDRMPEIGIPWALADFLEFKGKPCAFGEGGFHHRYDIDPVSLGEFAKRVASRTALIGESKVQAFGRLDMEISRIGIGTGCCCWLEAFRKIGCDAAVVCDDGISYWQDITWALEVGYPVIRINHGISEEPGMITLAEYINKNLEGITAEYFPHACGINIIG